MILGFGDELMDWPERDYTRGQNIRSLAVGIALHIGILLLKAVTTRVESERIDGYQLNKRRLVQLAIQLGYR